MKNPLHRKTKGAFLALLLIAVASCSHMNDDQRTRTQATAIGTTTGAVVGGGAAFGIAKLAGANNSTSALIGIGGGFLGGLLGYNYGKSWGDSIIQKKSAYRSTEEYMQANIKQTRTRLKQVTKENKALVSTISQLQAEKKRLLAENNREAVKSFNQGVKNDIKNFNAKLELIDHDIATARTVSKGTGAVSDQQMLRDNLEGLLKQRNTYNNNIRIVSNTKIGN